MIEPSRIAGLSERLREERATLDRLRSDYATITRSRFHALRMLWFSLKALLGFSSSKDVYAVASEGLSPAVLAGGRPRPELAPAREATPALPAGVSRADAESAMIAAWTARVNGRPMGDPPLVSVVIPVFNKREYTVACLHSIAESWFETLDVEFVIVDDASTDGSGALISALPGVRYLKNDANEGFIASCNRGAAIARGKYLCFLNNDTTVCGGWLDTLVSTAERDASIGVVGSKLVYPDGRLQEAGSILWRDATGWNVGRYESPDDPRYNFLRDVDYVSGASLLVRRDLFDNAGGFSEEFRPAYYEDADLCFGIRAMGYRVVYQPLSVVVHHEGVTSGNATEGVKRFQEVNRPRFREKWAAQLNAHLENDPASVPAAMWRGGNGHHILVIDSYVPLHDRESGSHRMYQILKMLLRGGYRVSFLPDNFAGIAPYTQQLEQMGVEVLHHVEGGRTMTESLNLVLPQIDLAWISRPHLYHKFEPLVRRGGAVRLVYDTVDLVHVRQRREAELRGEDDGKWRDLQRTEIEAARSADATVVVTPEEKTILEELGIKAVAVIPNVHDIAVHYGRRYEESAGVLFIGSYKHPPNIDAVQWLCNDVMPLVWRTLPDVKVTLIGSNPNDQVLALRSERVQVTGYVPDPSPYFRENRIFVAPLRYGAGMKGKIGQALAYALPVVTTPVGAEGLGLRSGVNAMIVPAEADAFAAGMIELYTDPVRWQQLSDAATQTLEPFTPEAVSPQLYALLERVTQTASV